MIKRLHHTAIIVSSEAGVDFYKELGFTEENRIDRGYDQIVWMNGYGEKIEIFVDSTHRAKATIKNVVYLLKKRREKMKI